MPNAILSLVDVNMSKPLTWSRFLNLCDGLLYHISLAYRRRLGLKRLRVE